SPTLGDDGALELHGGAAARVRGFRPVFIAAAGGRGKHLVRAQIAVRVKRLAQVGHGGQIVGGKHAVHKPDLLDSDSVLPRHTPATGQAFLEDFITGLENAVDLIGVALVKEQDRVNVAV